MALSPEHARGKLGATIPAKDVSGVQAFGVELILSFILVITMLASIEANKQAARRDYGTAAALGVVVTFCYLIAVGVIAIVVPAGFFSAFYFAILFFTSIFSFLFFYFQLPITGCGVNPARSFAPAILANTWNHHWVRLCSYNNQYCCCYWILYPLSLINSSTITTTTTTITTTYHKSLPDDDNDDSSCMAQMSPISSQFNNPLLTL